MLSDRMNLDNLYFPLHLGPGTKDKCLTDFTSAALY